ncbi:MAG: cupredoxin family copper-binding protein [Acidimicrobiia bacterium]
MRIHRTRTVLATAVFAVSVAVVGCSSGTDEAPTTTEAKAEASEVTIDNFRFDPAEVTVAAGDTVTWTNRQGVSHTTTSANGTWDSGSLSTDGSFAFVFDEAGTYDYFCAIHPSMTGSIVVTG